MSISRLRLAIITILLAAAAVWLSKPDIRSTQQDAITSSQLPYSWQTENTTIWRLQANQPENLTLIKSQLFTYHDEGKRSEFKDPELLIIDDSGITEVTALKGFSQNDNEVTFEQQVVVKQLIDDEKNASQTISAQRLNTEKLSYKQSNNHIYTDVPVVLTQENGVTTATGLEADLSTRQYRLLSNVQGLYDPKKLKVQSNHNQ